MVSRSMGDQKCDIENTHPPTFWLHLQTTSGFKDQNLPARRLFLHAALRVCTRKKRRQYHPPIFIHSLVDEYGVNTAQEVATIPKPEMLKLTFELTFKRGISPEMHKIAKEPSS